MEPKFNPEPAHPHRLIGGGGWIWANTKEKAPHREVQGFGNWLPGPELAPVGEW
ncbi:hypothetical protein ACVI1N_000830 [Sinorhizobium medicae]